MSLDHMTPAEEQRLGSAWDLVREASGLLCDLAQFMDGVKADLIASNSWSEWDQQMRDRITTVLAKVP